MQVQVPRSSTLEVEFYGEVGVGAGPTQEFYSCVCQEISRKEFKLWWDADANSGDYVSAPAGIVDFRRASLHEMSVFCKLQLPAYLSQELHGSFGSAGMAV